MQGRDLTWDLAVEDQRTRVPDKTGKRNGKDNPRFKPSIDVQYLGHDLMETMETMEVGISCYNTMYESRYSLLRAFTSLEHSQRTARGNE